MFKLDLVYNEPFPHMVVDGFGDEAQLRDIVRNWPQDGWQYKAVRTSIKYGMAETVWMPQAARDFIAALHAPEFMARLGEAFGMELHPDPQYAIGHLEGGGLHMIPRGGHLGMHVDFDRHPKKQWRRVLNLLVYLNEDWDDEWGGALRIEYQDGRLAKSVAPRFNRAVAFATSDHSWHGHPAPLRCPQGHSRKSVAIYYYSKAKAAEGHCTIYR